MAAVYSLTDRAAAVLQAIPPRVQLVSFMALGGAVWGTVRIYQDYRRWTRVGPGRLPPNPVGYTVASILKLVVNETRSTTPYTDAKIVSSYPPEAKASYLKGPLPVRRGGRPAIEPFAVPQRQAHGNAKHIRQLERDYFDQVAREHPSSLELGTSILEARGPAVFVSKQTTTPEWVQGIHGEIFHLHESEGSLHCNLSISDAVEVIEKGWGERLGLSGMVGMPHSFVLIYAPRDADEMETVKTILDASIRASTAGTAAKA